MHACTDLCFGETPTAVLILPFPEGAVLPHHCVNEPGTILPWRHRHLPKLQLPKGAVSAPRSPHEMGTTRVCACWLLSVGSVGRENVLTALSRLV